MNTYQDIVRINNKSLAIPNKLYQALDPSGVVRTWRGADNKRLLLLATNGAVAAMAIPPKKDDSIVATLTSTDSITLDYVASVPIAQYNPVTSDGKLADNNTLSTRNKLIGISITTTAAGFVGNAIGFGEVSNGSWSWTIGDKIFLNGTSLSTIAPTTGYSQMIGTATAVDTIDINIQPTIRL